MRGSGYDDEKMVWTAEQVQKISVCWACYSPGCSCNWEATLYVWTANTCRLLQGNIVFAFSALVEHLHTDHQFINANRSVSVNPAMLRIWFDCHELSGSTCHGWEIQTTKGEGGGGLWMVVGDSWWWALKLIWSNLAPCHCYLSVSVCLCLTFSGLAITCSENRTCPTRMGRMMVQPTPRGNHQV